MSSVPSLRLRSINRVPPRPHAHFVLYWMEAARRAGWNFALQRSIELAQEFGKPLVVLETVRTGHRWASARFHRLLLDGMADQMAVFENGPITYYPYVESEVGAADELLEALANRACAVVADEYPCLDLPREQHALGARIGTRLELVDGNGLLPLAAAERAYSTAYQFRRFLQKELPVHLTQFPLANSTTAPFPRGGATLIRAEMARWMPPTREDLTSPHYLGSLPVNHGVAPAPTRGGQLAAERDFERFLETELAQYPIARKHPDVGRTSGLSAALHYGHVSVHHLLDRLADREQWNPGRISEDASGKRGGWWGLSEAAEAFLDQLVTWRELGYNTCAKRKDYDEYQSLPDWARETLAEHEADTRPGLYSIEELETAKTSDPIWNAAQRELLLEGRIHGYLRMLWGKKILEWSEDPRGALKTMIHLNNKYAIDGRDPNSYSGIFWVLGRYDRPWPERPIFGKVRSMTSASTRRKLKLTGYLERFGVDA